MSETFNSHSNETNAANSEAQQMLDSFWQRVIEEIRNLGVVCHLSSKLLLITRKFNYCFHQFLKL